MSLPCFHCTVSEISVISSSTVWYITNLTLFCTTGSKFSNISPSCKSSFATENNTLYGWVMNGSNEAVFKTTSHRMTTTLNHTINVGWLVISVPFQPKNRLYRGQGVGWRFSSTRLRRANDTVTSWPRCLFVQRWPKMGKDRGGSFKLLH